MPSSPLGSTPGRTTSGMACHHRLWAAHTVERRRVWHDIIAFEQHTQLKDVERGMLSSPLGSTHGRMTLGVACHLRLWAAHTVERRRAWHDITSLGQNTRSDYVGLGMTSPPSDSTHGRMMSSVACHHRPWTAYTVRRRRAWHDITALGLHAWLDDVMRGITSSPLDCTHGQTMSGVA